MLAQKKRRQDTPPKVPQLRHNNIPNNTYCPQHNNDIEQEKGEVSIGHCSDHAEEEEKEEGNGKQDIRKENERTKIIYTYKLNINVSDFNISIENKKKMLDLGYNSMKEHFIDLQ